MNFTAFALVLFLPAAALPQAAIQTNDQYSIVRAIKITPVSTSPGGLPDVDQKIWAALAKVGARVETRLEPNDLVNVISKAERAIQDVYQSAGRSVRVQHETNQIPPGRSVEVKFLVIELCSCG